MSASINDLRADLTFGPADENLLRALAEALEPELPAITDALLTRFSELSVDATLAWLRSGLRGPWDAAFHENRTERAQDLAQRGVGAEMIVAVVHRLRSAYATRFAERGGTADDRLAIDKLLDLELAILLPAHAREAERQLMMRERRWQTDQRNALQTLTTGFAHELRNPLNSARLQLDVLERRIRRYLEDRVIAEPVALARGEIERLCALVEDFLAFAQPPPLQPVMCDLVTLVEHVVEVEQEYAHERSVMLSLVQPAQRWHARVDGDKLRQLIKNLVRNGLEAAPSGGSVEVAVTGEGDCIHIRVNDDGPGIPDTVRSRMFEPFFSTKDTGTGLGMSIVHSIVTMHRGTIEVASSSTGTRVDVMLPRAA